MSDFKDPAELPPFRDPDTTGIHGISQVERQIEEEAMRQFDLREPPTLFDIPGSPTGAKTRKSAAQIVLKAEANEEPVFVIRAKDSFALDTLQHYIRMTKAYGPTDEQRDQELIDIQEAMTVWRAEHMGQVRFAD